MEDADRSPDRGEDDASISMRAINEERSGIGDKNRRQMMLLLADETAKRRWAKLRVASILGGKVLSVAVEMGVPLHQLGEEPGSRQPSDSQTGHQGGDGLQSTSPQPDLSKQPLLQSEEQERRSSRGDASTSAGEHLPSLERMHGDSPHRGGAGAAEGGGSGGEAEGQGQGSSRRGSRDGGQQQPPSPQQQHQPGGRRSSWDEVESRENRDTLPDMAMGRPTRSVASAASSGGGAAAASSGPSFSGGGWPPESSAGSAAAARASGSSSYSGEGRHDEGGAAAQGDGEKIGMRRVSTMQRMATRLSSTIKRPWVQKDENPTHDTLQGVINRTFAAKSATLVYRDAGLVPGRGRPSGGGGMGSMGADGMSSGDGLFPSGDMDADMPEETPLARHVRRWVEFKPSLNRLMADPESSFAAKVVSWVILMLIVVSSTTFCLETMEEFDTQMWADVFWWAEVVSVTCFTVEYVLRLLSETDRLAFAKAPLNLVDLVAIMPFYIELLAQAGSGLGDTRIIRVVRLVRVFRVLKLGGRVGKLQVVGNAVADSADMLAMLGFLLVLAVILFSSLEYFAEKGSGGVNEEYFASIPASFWWCMVTLMTVGYGDVVPETILGQIVASATMIASVVILALPISVIGTNFTQQWMEFKNANKMKERSQLMIPRLQSLMVHTHLHMDVIEELVAAARDVELYAEKKANVLKADIRTHNTVVRTVRAGMPGIEVITAMASQKRLWRSMEGVKDGVMHLEELLAFMDLVSSSKFVNVLEQARTKYKRLSIINGEGHQIIEDVDHLQEDIEQLRAHFSNPYTNVNL